MDMKNIVKTIFLCLLCGWMWGCQEKSLTDTEAADASIAEKEGFAAKKRLTLRAGSPGDEVANKTVLTEGTVPMWQADDAIGVISDYGSGYELSRFGNDASIVSRATTFSGEMEHPEGDLYPVFPYYDAAPTANYVLVDIKRNQTVSEGTYDGTCDIMSGKKVILDDDGKQIENLRFKRHSAIVKVLLKNYPSEYAAAFATEKVESVRIKSSNRSLTGLMRLDWKNGEIVALDPSRYYSDAIATWPVSERIAMGSSHATYFALYPGTLLAGGQLTVTVETTNFSITKVISLDSDIVLKEGDGTLLNISLDRGDVTIRTKKVYIYFWNMDADPRNGKEMTRISEGVYQWEGWCFDSQFKFNTDNVSDESYWTGYFRDETAPAASYWTATNSYPATGDGGIFQLKDKGLSAGVYRINLNTNTNAVTCTALPMYLYITNGNDAPVREPLTNNGDGTYSWTGWMYRYKSFRVVTSATEKANGYMRNTGDSNYFSLAEYAADTTNFSLIANNMADGKYCVTVNPQPRGFASSSATAMTVRCDLIVDNLYLDCWAWGTALYAQAMTGDGNGNFTWNGFLPCDKFKFIARRDNVDDYWSGFFRDPDATDYLTMLPAATQVMFDVGALGTGWRGMAYTVKAHVNTQKVELIPHVWLIGAFSWGWDRAQAQEMSYIGNGILQWTGTVYANATFKFLIADNYSDGEAPASGYGSTYIRWYGFVRNTSSADYWTAVINDAADDQFDIANLGYETGTYTIRLDLNTMRVSVTPGSPSGTGVSITPIKEDPE